MLLQLSQLHERPDPCCYIRNRGSFAVLVKDQVWQDCRSAGRNHGNAEWPQRSCYKYMYIQSAEFPPRTAKCSQKRVSDMYCFNISDLKI